MSGVIGTAGRRRTDSRTITGAAAVLALIAGHRLAAARVSPTYVGWLLPVEHLYELAVACGLLALCAAVGDLALDRCGLLEAAGEERWFVAVAAGLGLVGTCFLALGAVGGLRPVPAALVVAGLAWVARRRLARLPAELGSGARSLRALIRRHRAAGAALVVAGAVVGFFLLPIAAAPPVEWDALMYHLRLPSLFVRQGRLFLPADSLYVSHVGPLHMLYALLLMAGGPSAPALFTGSLALVLGGLVLVLSRRLFGARTALLATALLWGTTTLLMVAGTARVGAAAVLFTLAANAVLLPPEGTRLDPRRVGLAGALLGLGFAVKVPGLVYAAALTPLLLEGARGLGDLLRRGVIYGAGFLAACAPWLAKDWALLGSPWASVVPGKRIVPWLAELYGRAGRTPDFGAGPREPLNYAFSLKDLFLAPQRMAVEPDGAYYFTNPALAFAPLALLLWRNRYVRGLVVPGFSYLALLLLHRHHVDLRYLLPIIPPLTMVTAHLLVTGLERVVRPGLARGLGVAVVLLALLPTGMTVTGWLRSTEALPHLAGAVSRQSFVDHHLLATVRSYGGMEKALRARPDRQHDRVLMLFEARGFGFGSSVIEDPYRTNWMFLSRLVPPDDCLDHPGFDEVLLNTGALGWYVRRGVDAEAWNLETLPGYEHRCLVPIERGPGFILFRRRAEVP